ncbi:MAG: oxidoreductase [Candidatus Lindowbacteria bacterium]|nr:oxidoreductase [Candidatus Lindowbacteria bacterium]
MEDSKSKRKRIKEIEVMVADVIKETPDTSTIFLFTGNDRLDYKAGHFLTINPRQFKSLYRFTLYLEDMKGKKETPRAYSMSSAPHEPHLAFTVKEERYISGQTPYPPLLSPMLVHRMKIGMRIMITGFTGPYTMPDDLADRTDNILHICAGSGVVPNFSIIKESLHNNDPFKHTLIFSNKLVEDIMFHRQFEELRAHYPDKFEVIYCATREEGDVNIRGGFKGRISPELIKKYAPDSSNVHCFVCGPGITKWDKIAAKKKGEEPTPRFLEASLSFLEELGIKKNQITRESYG